MVPSQSEYVRVQRTVLQASHTLAKKSRGALQLGQASTTAVTNDSFKRESSIETAAIAGKKTILVWKCSVSVIASCCIFIRGAEIIIAVLRPA